MGRTDEANVTCVLASFRALEAAAATFGGCALAAVIDVSKVFYALLLDGLA